MSLVCSIITSCSCRDCLFFDRIHPLKNYIWILKVLANNIVLLIKQRFIIAIFFCEDLVWFGNFCLDPQHPLICIERMIVTDIFLWLIQVETRPRWTETFVSWSPLGTYLGTFHGRWVKWGWTHYLSYIFLIWNIVGFVRWILSIDSLNPCVLQGYRSLGREGLPSDPEVRPPGCPGEGPELF